MSRRHCLSDAMEALESLMNHDRYEADYLAGILKSVRTIALLGASPNPERPSNGVMRFLLTHGYEVFPVNPGQAGKEINGRIVYGRLADVPQPVDMVDVFRASEYLDEVVSDALSLPQLPQVIWAQLGVRDDAAASRAEGAGIRVIMNRCPAIEIPRLLG
jgi:uncharacterized protein